MGNRGRLIAPGGLRDDLAAVAEDEPAAGESLAEMAAQYGLRPSSTRPRLASYLVKVWQRRHFIFAYATARNVSMYTEARLGQLWRVLTPLLNSAVYYLIFGILFKADRGISNYTAFLGRYVVLPGLDRVAAADQVGVLGQEPGVLGIVRGHAGGVARVEQRLELAGELLDFLVLQRGQRHHVSPSR